MPVRSSRRRRASRPRARRRRRRGRRRRRRRAPAACPRRGRGSSATSATPTAGWAASHGSSSSMPVRAADLDPARVDDRGGERASAGRRPARTARRAAAVARRRRRRSRGRRRRRDRVEVEPELELAARRAARTRRPGAPAVGPPGDPRRRERSRSRRRRAAARDRCSARLAGHRRQPLDQRPELVLAEQPDDRVAVVVAEPGRLEVELDRQVAHDPRQLAAHRRSASRCSRELVAQLLRRDLVEPRVQRVEVAELADQLGGGLLADARARPGCCRSGRP